MQEKGSAAQIAPCAKRPRLDILSLGEIFRVWNTKLHPGEIVEAQTLSVAAIDPTEFPGTVERLAEILHACVHEGASIGFVTPFDRSEARAYWTNRVAAPHAAGAKVLLVAALDGEIRGTAQLDLDSMPSKRHHAEVSKVLVDPHFRRAGVAPRPYAGDRTARGARRDAGS